MKLRYGTLTEIEDDCLKDIDRNPSQAIPWYIIFSYDPDDDELSISDPAMARLKRVLRENFAELDHKYKDHIDPITLNVNKFPYGTKGFIQRLKDTYNNE